MPHVRFTTVGLFLTAWLALSFEIASAQSADITSPADTASPDEAAAVFDINAIDPETFQALATRLPEGYGARNRRNPR